MEKVNALFLDYDGTISPLDVKRQQSRVLPHTEALLNVIRRFVPIGIITTKDLPFILPRTIFAQAWCAIAGLEMKVGSQLFVSQNVDAYLPSLLQALVYAKQNAIEGLEIEEKCNYAGLPLAFCIDWRSKEDNKECRKIASQIMSFCRQLPLKVIEHPGHPFFDVFPCVIDKGRALNQMKEKINIADGIVYMGDSITDNPAFREADISIGVTSGRKPSYLNCTYWIKFDDVAFFFSNLYKHGFIFSPDLPGIRLRE